MYLEITNDIHLGLKFGCCNAENRKRDLDIQYDLSILNPGDTLSVSCNFRIDGLPEGKHRLVICSEAGILYDVFSSRFMEVTVNR